MQRALAVPGKDDRPVAGLLEELVERRRDVAIGEVERRLGILAVEQERAVRRLPVSRRPDLAGAVECACLALDEQVGSERRVAAGVERRVPAVGLR